MRSHVLAGDEVDNFQIGELVSTTAVASLFRAIDTQTDAPVLIKFPNPDVETDPVLSDRFKREQEIGAALNHPGLLKTIQGPHSRPYIVTEYFDGKFLRQLLESEKTLSVEQSIRIALKICEVLYYVEGHGVFHRDLRPENIMVGADDTVKLINFGGAAMVGARRITFTTISHALGVSDYLAPEELSGTRTDSRTDVYSLGVILYEMITGKTPFAGLNPFGRPGGHPLDRQGEGGSLSSFIPVQLEQILYNALQPNPTKRYRNADRLAADLRNLDGVSVRRRTTLIGKLRSNRLVLYGAMALLPILIFALLFLFARH
jgi:eukaryotic-like serine/threonine-protein kinase